MKLKKDQVLRRISSPALHKALTKPNVLVTRPKPYGVLLCNALRAEGYQVTYLPTIVFKEPKDRAGFLQAIASLRSQNWVIFISREAVSASIRAIKLAWPHFPSQVKLAAIGEGTAKALQAEGYSVDLVPSEWTSEGLLSLAEMQNVHGQKIAIIRGLGGREYIDQILHSRGAEVLPVIAYQRELPRLDVTPFCELFKQGKMDVMIGTSYEGIRHLKILLGANTWDDMKDIPLIVVSDRIKILAGDLGYKSIWVARNASHAAILEALFSISQIRKEES